MNKFCKDCKFIKINFMDRIVKDWIQGKCMNPDVTETIIDLVGGKVVVTGSDCSTQRSGISYAKCGPEGKLWEAK